MAKTILTPKQSQFLELAASKPEIAKHYYLTGGTALAEYYLHHRLSEDIDLFTDTEEVNQSAVQSYLKKISPVMQIATIQPKIFLGLASYLLTFTDQTKLKIDFNYYPFPRIENGKNFHGLAIDSLRDIATNKLHTIYMKPRSRDFIDLYLILDREKYVLEKLIMDAKIKFDWHIDPITLSSQFLRVKDLTELPTMLIPFDRGKMEKFYLALAKQLGSKILK